VLVSVGQNANRIAGYGLLKCFVHDASPPSNHAMFRETAQCFRTRPRLRPLQSQCAQLTLVSARDFSVTDANRTNARARFYRRRSPFSHRSVFYHSQRSEPTLHACLRPSTSAKLRVIIGTRRCVYTTAVLHALAECMGLRGFYPSERRSTSCP
jgi:hypothetical protein